MNPFQSYDLLKWMHFLCLALIGGGAVVSLLLSGFEEDREDLRGLAATVWKKTVCWGVRLAIVVGAGLLVMKLMRNERPFDWYYLHVKLMLVVFLAGLTEATPKALAVGKRGSALLAVFLFLLTSFTVYNKSVFGVKQRSVDTPKVTVAPQP